MGYQKRDVIFNLALEHKGYRNILTSVRWRTFKLEKLLVLMAVSIPRVPQSSVRVVNYALNIV